MQGLSAFRIMRDEAYLKDMLEVISMLYCQYVVRGVQPPVNVFMGLPVYERLLQGTLGLARRAQRVHVPLLGPFAGENTEPFLLRN